MLQRSFLTVFLLIAAPTCVIGQPENFKEYRGQYFAFRYPASWLFKEFDEKHVATQSQAAGSAISFEVGIETAAPPDEATLIESMRDNLRQMAVKAKARVEIGSAEPSSYNGWIGKTIRARFVDGRDSQIVVTTAIPSNECVFFLRMMADGGLEEEAFDLHVKVARSLRLAPPAAVRSSPRTSSESARQRVADTWWFADGGGQVEMSLASDGSYTSVSVFTARGYPSVTVKAAGVFQIDSNGGMEVIPRVVNANGSPGTPVVLHGRYDPAQDKLILKQDNAPSYNIYSRKR